jgi:hypothetical protein
VVPDVADPATEGKWRRPDLRNHRKIVVVDGRVAFVGSLNMIDASYHNPSHERAGRKWRELVMELNGPVVFSLDIVFATDWYIETDEVLHDVRPHPDQVEPGDVMCQVVPSGPGFPDENNLRLFNSLIIPRNADSRSPAHISCPMSHCCTRSRLLHSVASMSSSSLVSRVISSWSTTRSALTTKRC